MEQERSIKIAEFVKDVKQIVNRCRAAFLQFSTMRFGNRDFQNELGLEPSLLPKLGSKSYRARE